MKRMRPRRAGRAWSQCLGEDQSTDVTVPTVNWGWTLLSTSLATMTTCGHDVTMKAVRIAELKARLSEYLRAVRRGETIAVLDRDPPVAQIVPVRDRTALRIRKPAPGALRPNQISPAKPLKLNVDVVELLLEERRAHR